MLINLSNHPFAKWSDEQLKAACEYGTIHEITFPYIPPEWGTEQVKTQAYDYFRKIENLEKETGEKPVIHLAGEPVFCFHLTGRLLQEGYTVLASTTERIVVEGQDGEKKSVFKFNRFRPY